MAAPDLKAHLKHLHLVRGEHPFFVRGLSAILQAEMERLRRGHPPLPALLPSMQTEARGLNDRRTGGEVEDRQSTGWFTKTGQAIPSPKS